METLGPAAESLRLAEHYRQLADDELIAVAHDTSDLTELAQAALAQEMSTRKLKMPEPEPEIQPIRPVELDSDSDDAYAQDRQLVELCTVWSMPDAQQLQRLLDQEEAPFFMGPEQATRAEEATSIFANGVSVKVMQIGLPWAQQALQHYEPADEPPKQNQSEDNLAVHCPKCHSEDVIFETLVKGQAGEASTQKYAWECASCGNHWVDDGVETKN